MPHLSLFGRTLCAHRRKPATLDDSITSERDSSGRIEAVMGRQTPAIPSRVMG